MMLERAYEGKGYFKLGVNLKLANKPLMVYGYNGPSVSIYEEKALQVGMEKVNSVAKTSDLFLWHIVSTNIGNSGSPIMT